MASYNLSERFSPEPKYFRLLDPGSYQGQNGICFTPNKVPFNSKSIRSNQMNNKIWTHQIYNADLPRKIPNCTSLSSKVPRFPYEAFNEEDLKEFLCRCGLPCECPTEEIHKIQPLCQGKIPKRLIIGPTPWVAKSRRTKEKFIIDLPFYDSQVNESTAFYQGCKWSHWTSNRTTKQMETRPGPNAYDLNRKPTDFDICAEKVRAHKRKNSRQPRFIEMVQQMNLREGRPGPGSYTPTYPKGTELNYLGPKADRFSKNKYNVSPGPTEYVLQRCFDLPDPPSKLSHANLPEPAFFGVKDIRFKPRVDKGPGPATYFSSVKTENIVHCPGPPFNSTAPRWSPEKFEESDEEDPAECDQVKSQNICPSRCWMFKSKTIRMKPLKKKPNVPSPADLPMQFHKVDRLDINQCTKPFNSSEGRFFPWNDWMPLLGKEKTPGPAYYCLEKPKCYPAFKCGPLFRSPRFPKAGFPTPAPNQYRVGAGIESVLNTHNNRLQTKISNQHKFKWEPPRESERLCFKEREMNILNNSIAILDDEKNTEDQNKTTKSEKREKPKLLRCFLYYKQVPNTT